MESRTSLALISLPSWGNSGAGSRQPTTLAILAPAKLGRRIDFVVVSQHFDAGNIATWTATEFDLLNVNDDHDAVAMQVGLEQTCNGSKPPMLDRVRKFDQRKLKDPDTIQAVEFWIDAFGLQWLAWELDVNLHAHILQEVLHAIVCHVAPVDSRGPVSSYVPAAAWEIRGKRQAFKKRTAGKRWTLPLFLLRGAWDRWTGSRAADGNNWELGHKRMLLYDVSAAAVKFSTLTIRRLIRECKNEKLGDIAKNVGHVTPAAIFKRLKELAEVARPRRTACTGTSGAGSRLVAVLR